MNEFETSLLSSLKIIFAEQFKAFEERLLKKKVEFSDDLLETQSVSNSQDDLNKVFDSGLSFSYGIESTGIDSQLINDAGNLKSGYENIGLIESEFIESKLTEDKVDVNWKPIPLDSGEDSSSETVFSQNSSTPSATYEGNSLSTPIIDFYGVDGSSVVNEVQKYNGKSVFLDYQEGKPFVSEHNSLNIALNSQDRKVINGEVNDFKLIKRFSYLAGVYEFGFDTATSCSFALYVCSILMSNYNENCAHEMTNKHGYQSDGLFNDSIAFMLANYGVPSTAWEMLCKILHRGTVNWIVVIQQLLKKYEAKKYCYSCLDCTHKVFDRGKEFRVIEFWWVFMCARGRVIDRGKWFELSWITSYYVSISSKISVGMPTSVVVVLNRLMLLLKTYTYFVYQLIIKLGYGLELVFETWNAFFLVKSGNILDACKLFEKIWQHITILWTNVILTKRKIGFGNAHELSAQLFARDVRLARQINEAGVGFMEMGIPLEGSARLLTLKPIFLIESSILIFFFVFEFNLFFYGLWSMGNVCAYPLDFMEQEIISVNNTMLIVWMLNFLELNLWVFLSEIKLFILFLLNGYEKKMHDSVVWSLSKDADFLLLGFSNGLPTGIKLLHVSSMKTNINTGEKSDVSKILVLSLGGNIGFLSQKTVVTVCDEFSTGRPRSILQWVMLFTASNVPAGKLFSRKWLGVLTSEDHVGLHDYSLMVTMLVIRSYCLLLGVSFFLPSLIHAFTMNDNHNTQKKFMKETIFPGLLVFNTLEDTRKIVWFNMGYRGMECYERRREIKRMLAKASAGAISGHEWVEEMLMRVNCCCTQPGVAVSKLTVMLTQTCSLLEDNGVVCGVLLSVNISENNIQLNEIVHDITKAISIVVLIGPDFFSSILKSRWEFEIGSWELSLHIALSTPDSAKSRITEAIMHSFKWVSPLLVMALHSLMIYSFCIQEYTILRRLWHEIFTILATSLRVSTSHHCCTAGPREEMNISISHNGMVGCFLVKILSASYKSEYGELVLKPKSSSVQLIGTNMELAYYTISEIEVVTAKRKGYCASQDILILVELLFHGVFEGSIVLTQVLTAPALQDGLCEYSTFLYTTNRIYADSGTCLLHYSSRCYATFSRLRSATFEYERGQSLLRFAEKVLPHSLLWARSFPTFILEVEC